MTDDDRDLDALRARVRDLPELEPEPGWEGRAHARWRAARAADRRRRRRVVLGAVAAAAVAV
ncbi:MAG TPA: hypothetical protein VHE35_24820, partial [Kofleriaceae bacterium]|nr:hypothetical protein [Kofleriaceae bacterium]